MRLISIVSLTCAEGEAGVRGPCINDLRRGQQDAVHDCFCLHGLLSWNAGYLRFKGDSSIPTTSQSQRVPAKM